MTWAEVPPVHVLIHNQGSSILSKYQVLSLLLLEAGFAFRRPDSPRFVDILGSLS